MTTSALPSATACRASFRARPLTEPVSSTARTGRPLFSIYSANPSICCRASTSVGAMRAPCRPFSAHRTSARKARIVLPEPTSPCRSLFISQGPVRSVRISSQAVICSCVRVKGRLSRSLSGHPDFPGTCVRLPPISPLHAVLKKLTDLPSSSRQFSRMGLGFKRFPSSFFCLLTPTINRKNSSKISLRRAACSFSLSGGK